MFLLPRALVSAVDTAFVSCRHICLIIMSNSLIFCFVSQINLIWFVLIFLTKPVTMMLNAVGLRMSVTEDGSRNWTNRDKTTPSYFNWKSGSPCRRNSCNSARSQGRCAAVGARRQMVDRKCDSGRRRAVCSRPASVTTWSSTRRRRRPRTSSTTSWTPGTQCSHLQSIGIIGV